MESEIAVETDDGSIDLAATWQAAQAQLDDLDDLVEVTKLAIEFAQVCAVAIHRGDDTTETTADTLIGRFAKSTDVKKSSLRENMDAALEELEEEAGEKANDQEDENSGPTMMGLVAEHLDELVLYQPTDASAAPRYSWRFDTGVEVETEREHLSVNEFAQSYHVASEGRYNPRLPLDPNFKQDDWAWPEYIRDVIKTHREDDSVRIIEVEGVRTHAVEDLRQAVESKPATTEAGEAAQQQRAYLDPENPEVVQIGNKVVDRVVSQYNDCNARDLQIELEERGHRAGNVRQVKVSDGKTVRFWQLNAEWLDVELPEDADVDTAESAEGTS